MSHPLLGYLLDAADGRLPPVDGGVTVLPALDGGLECSVALTGHALIATALPAEAVRARGPDGFGGSLAPDFLRWLAGDRGWIDVNDAILVGRGRGGAASLPERADLAAHPRVRHAFAVRRNVRVYGDARGLVTLADGLAGRREISIEAAPEGQGRGWGRSLLVDAMGLVPAGESVFAAVAPGNARSLRAFLGVGFHADRQRGNPTPRPGLGSPAPTRLCGWLFGWRATFYNTIDTEPRATGRWRDTTGRNRHEGSVMQLTLIGTDPDSYPGGSATIYRTDSGSWVVQGSVVTDPKVLAQMNIPDGETAVEIPDRIVHFFQEG